MKRLILSITAAALALSVFSVSTSAMAQDAMTENQIKYRKAVMTAVRGNLGAMVGIMKGVGNKADLPTYANALVSLAKISPTLFPEGSDFGETTALPVIWEKPEEFSKAMKAFEDAAVNVASAAGGGDMAAFGAAFKGLGESCKGCHENFREKKERK